MACVLFTSDDNRIDQLKMVVSSKKMGSAAYLDRRGGIYCSQAYSPTLVMETKH